MVYNIMPTSFNYKDSLEGKIYPLEIQNIPLRKLEINPSDYRMIERFIFQKQ